jgi:sugar lactone lactonase YvrE
VAFDGLDNLYFADVANASVFYKSSSKEDSKPSELQILVKDFEGNPLKGPCSIAINRDENSLIVCDAGNFGTTSLNRATGSIFLIELDTPTKISRPLLLNCLAYPADVIFDGSTGIAYVCETFNNRVIRFIQSPPGVYHSSVFHQFTGRLGPTAISIDELGNIYVARYEFQSNEVDVDGVISVLNREGYLVGELIVPKMPEITSLCISAKEKQKDSLFLTEKSFNGVLKIKLSQFVSEIYKLEENNKII